MVIIILYGLDVSLDLTSSPSSYFLKAHHRRREGELGPLGRACYSFHVGAAKVSLKEYLHILTMLKSESFSGPHALKSQVAPS
jgi:hypothetical protein